MNVPTADYIMTDPTQSPFFGEIGHHLNQSKSVFLLSGVLFPRLAHFGYYCERSEIFPSWVIGCEFNARVSIRNGCAYVCCVASSQDIDFLATKDTVLNAVDNYLRPQLDLIGFQQGLPFEAIFDNICFFSQKDGICHPIIRKIDVLANISGVFKAYPSPEIAAQELMNVVTYNRQLYMALSDLRRFYMNPNEFGLWAGRAVDCIRVAFEVEEQEMNGRRIERDESWSKLKSTLKIDTSYHDLIRVFSNQQRHGYSNFVSSEELRVRVAERAVNIISRYFEVTKAIHEKRITNSSEFDNSHFELLIDEFADKIIKYTFSAKNPEQNKVRHKNRNTYISEEIYRRFWDRKGSTIEISEIKAIHGFNNDAEAQSALEYLQSIS